MGYCNYCNTYYKKQSGDICNNCSREITCTPPSINNSMKQLELIMHKKTVDLNYENAFKKHATLMDLAANEMMQNKELILNLVDILPDGNLPWYALLKAWYRHNKKRGRNLNTEKKPRDRLLKLLDINLVQYKIIDDGLPFEIDDLDNTYIIYNNDIESLDELDKMEELDSWYFEID